ncbi:MAG: hypothetical protein H0Z33_13860 [Bacillaceae bacterium]|nr:hypothetical protein [Bacillaceae bacterium]
MPTIEYRVDEHAREDMFLSLQIDVTEFRDDGMIGNGGRVVVEYFV